ncbi:MAG TPA: hypothetical protein DEA08_07530 [Planctomycetes bacterium]|nr:hypothetical protein [Planctomycetota bacterium]
MSERQTKVSKRIPKSGSGKAPAKATSGKTGRSKRPPKKARTGKMTRVKKGGRKPAPDPAKEKELEPITPFQRGLSIGVKFAGLTACVVGLFMGLLGFLTYSITAREMDAQINEQGAALVETIETSLDRGIWVETPEREVQDKNNKQVVFVEKAPTREELLARWKQRFREIVETSDGKVLRLTLIERKGNEVKLAGGYPDDNQLSLGGERTVGKEGDVEISELSLGGRRVRRFSKQVSVDLEKEKQILQLIEVQLPQAEPGSEAFQATIKKLRDLTGADIQDMQSADEYRMSNPIRQMRAESQGFTPELWTFVRAARLDDVKDQLWKRIAVVTLCGAVAGILLTVLISAVLTGPIRELETDIAEVAGGNMEHQSRVRSTDEIGALAHVFNIMARNLRTAQENAVERQAFERELNIAKEIQEKLLPERIPQIPGLDIHSHYKSAKEVGGDYYDFIVIDQTHLGIIVADVAGKGIPGAMVMTMARSLVRLASVRNVSPGDTFKKVNRILAKDIRRGMFVTSAYMVLNVKTRTLKVASAGHNPVVLFRAASGENELIKPKGIALGFDKGTIFDNNIQEAEVQLEPGDRIVTYTDGVNEAMNNESEEFGDDRFYSLVKEHAGKSSKDFVDAVVTALDSHRGSAEQSDDITIVTLSVNGGA